MGGLLCLKQYNKDSNKIVLNDPLILTLENQSYKDLKYKK